MWEVVTINLKDGSGADENVAPGAEKTKSLYLDFSTTHYNITISFYLNPFDTP